MNRIWTVSSRNRRQVHRWWADGGSGYWDRLILQSWDLDSSALFQSSCGAFYGLWLPSGRPLIFSRDRLHSLIDDRANLRSGPES